MFFIWRAHCPCKDISGVVSEKVSGCSIIGYYINALVGNIAWKFCSHPTVQNSILGSSFYMYRQSSPRSVLWLTSTSVGSLLRVSLHWLVPKKRKWKKQKLFHRLSGGLTAWMDKEKKSKENCFINLFIYTLIIKWKKVCYLKNSLHGTHLESSRPICKQSQVAHLSISLHL